MTGKKLKPGDRLEIQDELKIEYLGRSEAGDTARLKVQTASGKPPADSIEQLGLPPIPPYIRGGKSDERDSEDYQTVFASNEEFLSGSVAAPTAGLHFDEELLLALKEKGVETGYLTLELGRNSIAPISAEAAKGGELPEELFLIPEELKKKIQNCRAANKKIVAVGTTSARALESAALAGEISGYASDSMFKLSAHSGGFRGTRLCISPGFQFQVVSSMITNFHLPNSSHLMLVNAFSGSGLTEEIYRHALIDDYRFFSYGDGMLIPFLPD